MEPKRVLLVSSEKADQLVDNLKLAINCLVMLAKDGESALALAKHVGVDVVVLLSTGDAMGRTETALNFRDIRPYSEIIFVVRDANHLTQGETAAKEIPNTKVLTLQQLGNYLAAEH